MTATLTYREAKVREIVKAVYFGWSIRGIAQAGTGGPLVGFAGVAWEKAFRTPRPLHQLPEMVERGVTHVMLELVNGDGRKCYPDYAVSEFAEPFRWEPNDRLRVDVNQGMRDAYVLAVLGDEALIEYEMPNRTTALWVIPANVDPPGKIRNLSYRTCPRKWLDAIEAAGTQWEGNGQ